MNTLSYATDLTDEQWAILEPLIPISNGAGRPRSLNMRRVIDAILYLTRTGCQWRMLPHDFPKHQSVYHYFRKWTRDGTWAKFHDALVAKLRPQPQPEPTPSEPAPPVPEVTANAQPVPQPQPGSATPPKDQTEHTASIDSQTIKSAGMGGERGYDPAKNVVGRKRHILVNSTGLILALLITAADVPDAVAAQELIKLFDSKAHPHIKTLLVDGAYNKYGFPEFIAEHTDFKLEIVNRPFGCKGWVKLPKRWLVERTFGWLIRSRRLCRVYERTIESDKALVHVSMMHLMLRRMHPDRSQHQFKYRKAS